MTIAMKTPPLSSRSTRRLGTTGALLVAALLTGCATSNPVVYQRPGVDTATANRVAADTAQCRQQAEKAVGLNGRDGAGMARDSAQVAATGFVAATAASLAAGSRDVWQRARGAAAGGFAGMFTKAVMERNLPDDVHQEYVERCMKDRGHHVLGWR